MTPHKKYQLTVYVFPCILRLYAHTCLFIGISTFPPFSFILLLPLHSWTFFWWRRQILKIISELEYTWLAAAPSLLISLSRTHKDNSQVTVREMYMNNHYFYSPTAFTSVQCTASITIASITIATVWIKLLVWPHPMLRYCAPFLDIISCYPRCHEAPPSEFQSLGQWGCGTPVPS